MNGRPTEIQLPFISEEYEVLIVEIATSSYKQDVQR